MHSQIYSINNTPLSINITTDNNNCFRLPPFNIAFPEALLHTSSEYEPIDQVENPCQIPHLIPSLSPSSSRASPSPCPQQLTTTTISNNIKPQTLNWSHQFINFSNAFPNLIVKKRPRSKFEEVKRLYPCKYPNCGKAYGALNHLNAHIVSKGHGPKSSPLEFQDLRKAIKLRII